METVFILIMLPAFASLMVLASSSERIHYVLTAAVLGISGVMAAVFYCSDDVLTYHFSYLLEMAVMIADAGLLLYFLYQGFKFNSRHVIYLAALQLLLYGYAEYLAPSEGSAQIVVDTLSRFMFLIINIVGGIIVVYAVRYMHDEAATPFKKRVFIAGLLSFISVMNAIVCANSILLFFFLFEMTTLASFLLIGFRNDAISRTNALKALWMNQIGGVVILLGALAAMYSFGSQSFDTLLEHTGGLVLLSAALLSMAALVKGASIPFDGWLLGAMVAPTPVSAMLHSAAMVKIAPYLILKLAPLLEATLVGGLLSSIGALVFVAASYLALSRSVLKEILGYSTVALLGLMMALAALGSEAGMTLAMVLLLFHALSKALLFLAAGVLEKGYHVKNIEEMKGMVHRAPKTVGFILFGFVSLTLPPFGLLMGKLFAINLVASMLQEQPWLLIVLLGIVVGSTLLVLLYFKIASALLSNPSDIIRTEKEALSYGFALPMIALSALIVAAAAGFIIRQNSVLLGLFVLPLLFVMALPLIVRGMDRYDRIQTYRCGEKEPFDAALVYFEPSVRIKRIVYWGFGAMFVAVALAGAVS